MLNKAFLLAYFIHGNKETAVRVVSGAMSKLDVAATAQGKRFYYQPGGRSLLRRTRSIGFRNKVTFNELHLLQRLIYIESEVYEKEKEQTSSGAALGKEDMIVRFIKHLVRITLKRNSFYVTLGMSRLLYNYTTQETMRIYNVVVQDPERVKDDYYYRSRKGVLMQEIKERFGDLIKISHGQRGEERFQAEPEREQFADLVRECLSFFTPWATPCLVPAGFDPISDSIPSLLFEGSDKEDQIEVNRIHAALHPNCYQRLIEALGFPLPDQRLELPHFFLSNENSDRNQGSRDRHPNQELGVEDLNTIKQDLSELAERRRKASTGLLRILLDGVEYNSLDLKGERRVRFDLHREPELVEIWTKDETGDLLLASHLITYQQSDSAEPLQTSLFLDDNQEVSIVVSPSTDVSRAVVEISYEGSHPDKAAPVFRQPLTVLAAGHRLFAGYQSGFGRMGHIKFLIPALTFLFLIILTGVAVRYIQRGAHPSPAQQVANNKQTKPSASAEGNGLDTQAADSNAAAVGSQKTPELVGKQPASEGTQPAQPATENSTARSTQPQSQPPSTSVEQQTAATESVSSEREVTRGPTPGDAAVSLLEVKRVYVESGGEASGQLLRQMLVRQLQLSGRFSLSKTRDEADALFKVTTRLIRSNPRNRSQTESLSSVLLVNARGDVIWPVKDRSSRGRYLGLTPEQVSAQVLKDLDEDIEHLRRRH
ncbi:MAG: hypothetical protein ND866_32680 [Pyrinomonadaceae bacterium]|nr:hypothetical protein [Pyrinomonadaceae bacterium]